MRRLLIALSVLGLGLVILLAVADRVAARVVASAVAVEIQRSENLVDKPGVEIRGFPFLSQALRGRYGRVEVSAVGIRREGVRIERLDAVLSDVRVSARDVLAGRVGAVPVGDVSAEVLITYADLNATLSPEGLTVRAEGDRLQVRREVEVFGRTVSAAADAAVSVRGDTIVLTASRIRLGNDAADALVTRALAGRLDATVPVTGLPLGLRLSSASVGPDGLSVAAAGSSIVLTR